MRTFDTCIRPLQRLIGRAGEHHEQTRRIGAVLVNQNLRVDTVVLRLRHLFRAADHHGFAVGFQNRTRGATALVGGDIHVGGVEPLLLAVGFFAIESRRHHHALSQQVGKRLVEFEAVVVEQIDIAHQLRKETCIEQMQNGVFDAADVLIDAALEPVGRAFVDHLAGVVGAGVAHEVPGRLDEGIHRVGFALGRLAALRASGLVKLGHAGER